MLLSYNFCQSHRSTTHPMIWTDLDCHLLLFWAFKAAKHMINAIGKLQRRPRKLAKP